MIKVAATTDDGLIKAVLGHPVIWKTVSDGDVKINDYPIDHNDTVWLVMSVDNSIIAMYNFESLNKVSIRIHAHVLPAYREEYSRQTGLEALRWVKDNESWVNKVIAEVPTLYPNVANFAISLGFKDEGLNRASYFKQGSIYDQWMLGITIDEIRETLNE